VGLPPQTSIRVPWTRGGRAQFGVRRPHPLRPGGRASSRRSQMGALERCRLDWVLSPRTYWPARKAARVGAAPLLMQPPQGPARGVSCAVRAASEPVSSCRKLTGAMASKSRHHPDGDAGPTISSLTTSGRGHAAAGAKSQRHLAF